MNLANRSPTPAASTSLARLVLLADGSAAHRRLMRVQLERAGYRVIEAADGDTALRLCREAAPDVILSDWLLGGCSGIDLCRDCLLYTSPSPRD